jgi:hypothetical protein
MEYYTLRGICLVSPFFLSHMLEIYRIYMLEVQSTSWKGEGNDE